jgi:hypothetical protein
MVSPWYENTRKSLTHSNHHSLVSGSTDDTVHCELNGQDENTYDGKTARGASSPAKPALHIPDPLSTTKAAISSIRVLGL